MSPLWLLFASLTVAGSLAYNMGMKLGTESMNAFTFTLILTLSILAIQVPLLLAAKYVFHQDIAQGFETRNIMLAVMAGLGAALIDIACFFALRYGTVTATQIFWAVGSTIAVALFSALFFKEQITAARLAGIVLGVISLYLITRES